MAVSLDMRTRYIYPEYDRILVIKISRRVPLIMGPPPPQVRGFSPKFSLVSSKTLEALEPTTGDNDIGIRV